VLYVCEDIDDVAVGILDEEAPDAPRLVRQWVDDAHPHCTRALVRYVDASGISDVNAESAFGVAIPRGVPSAALRAPVVRAGRTGSCIATFRPNIHYFAYGMLL
jgi:hypothetical protein